MVVLDNFSYGAESLLNALIYPNFKLLKGCISSADLIRNILEKYEIDTVVHLAAIVGDPACAKHPELAKKVNFDASLQLIDISRERGVHNFLFASTCSNYGRVKNPMDYVNEASPLAPVSLYAELKVQIEKFILQEINQNGNFFPTVLRFSTAYGLSSRMRFDLTVNEFTKELVLGRELKVFGEQFWRPYCHVIDLSRAMLRVLESDEEKIAYNVFNVGDTAENYQKRMIVEEILKIIPGAQVKYIQKVEDPRDYRVSFDKIQQELGFKISRKVPEGVREIKQILQDKLIMNPDDKKYGNI